MLGPQFKRDMGKLEGRDGGGLQPSGRELGWVSLGKCELVTACSYPKGRYEDDGAKLFWAVADTLTRGSVHTLQRRRFWLDMSETFFPRTVLQL